MSGRERFCGATLAGWNCAREAMFKTNCVLHSFPGEGVLIEEDGHIGHGAVLHGCIIRRNGLVGINAVILDHADIGEDLIVGAGALVPAKFVAPPRSLSSVRRAHPCWCSPAPKSIGKPRARCFTRSLRRAALPAWHGHSRARAGSGTRGRHAAGRCIEAIANHLILRASNIAATSRPCGS